MVNVVPTAEFGLDADGPLGLGDDAVHRGQPQPVPPPSPLVVKKGSKTWAMTSSGMPVPVSLTCSRTCAAADTDGPPAATQPSATITWPCR